jgi:hypothetical protein
MSTLSKLPSGTVWRDAVAGDQPHFDGIINPMKLSSKLVANRGKRGFTYTHHKMGPFNQGLVGYANHGGFTINLSADSLEEADDKADLDIGPVVVTVPRDFWTGEPNRTPKGRVIVRCPHETHGIQCVDCKLCAVSTRKSIVGFTAHGSGARKVEEVFNERSNRT